MTIPFFGYAGAIPTFLDAADPRPAREQINERYRWGGWKPFTGFKLVRSAAGEFSLVYPDDPPRRAVAFGQLREELIVLFESDWLMILQRDGSYEIARVD